ncbi:MAG: glycosyltransferase family 39 protein [Aquabacterium sp.]|nr:glycosyltransferase family 39 protein [Aquabacterium sp.]
MAVLIWLSCTAWWRPLAVPDEGRYAGVAWEMIRSGDWLTPTLNGLPFFHKPPLFYWLTAVSLQTFGLTVWAARMASVLGALLGAMALYGLVRRWSGPRLASWSLLALVTQPFYFGGAQYANLDMLVAGCISAAVALAAHAVLSREAGLPYRLTLWGAYGLAGLGLLSKGLIGLVLPGAIIVLWMIMSGRWRAILGLLSLPGLLVLTVVAAPWFVAMQHLYPDFFHYFFVYQHFQRFTQTGFNNVHAWWYYLPLMAALSMPWVPAWLVAVWWPRAVSTSTPASTKHSATPDLRGLMWSWLVVVVVFFSIPASKLPGYVLPALPPLGFLIADALMRRWPTVGAWTTRLCAGVAGVLCVTLIGVTVKYDDQSSRPVLAVIQPLLKQGVPLVYVDEFVYDLPFYLARQEPVPVISDWTDPELPKHDNDRKELFDAGVFRPQAASRFLVDKADWPRWLCTHPRLAVMAPHDAIHKYPALASQLPVMRLKLWSLWVLDRDDLVAKGLHCPLFPS